MNPKELFVDAVFETFKSNKSVSPNDKKELLNEIDKRYHEKLAREEREIKF